MGVGLVKQVGFKSGVKDRGNYGWAEWWIKRGRSDGWRNRWVGNGGTGTGTNIVSSSLSLVRPRAFSTKASSVRSRIVYVSCRRQASHQSRTVTGRPRDCCWWTLAIALQTAYQHRSITAVVATAACGSRINIPLHWSSEDARLNAEAPRLGRFLSQRTAPSLQERVDRPSL